MIDGGIAALAGLGIALGLRHGIDWDHIAAITDITGSTVANEEAGRPASTLNAPHVTPGLVEGMSLSLSAGLRLADGSGSAATMSAPSSRSYTPGRRWGEARTGFLLATMYALGHAFVVVALGLLAIWASRLLPEWLTPIMERIVGLTLLLLGAWIIVSLVRYGKDFRLQSRWMLVFSAARRGWARVKSRVTGGPIQHVHDYTQYGRKTAFGIGMLHGVGAETGSQALLLASAAGATTRATGSLLLVFFAMGLVVSNSLIAVLSTFGFVSTTTKRSIYVGIGIIAAFFSIVVGLFFITGRGASLPNLQSALNFFGPGTGSGN